ncbi:GGDEF domain-containing protein [Salaquimonas pukyongi]|uniref:GGDEF domain-containing protein n=1 Tax=Salaquimonas pukyongi TaxID=2712698 RepID=UPI00096B9E01|nr:GGDEF domain-containing protein [Salaquimonas pukyongi]
MELSIAGVITAVGFLFGINFVGLFIAAYLFDRTAKHIPWYLIATCAFMLNGLSYMLSLFTPYKALFLAGLELFQIAGFIAIAYGFASAFSLRPDFRFLFSIALGCIAVAALHFGGDEIGVMRLLPLSLLHAGASLHLAVVLFYKPNALKVHRMISVMLIGTAIASLSRPASAHFVSTLPELTHPQKVELYASIVNLCYLTSLFGLGASVFFHVMSDFANGYRRASIIDHLTGLLNRRGFMEMAAKLGRKPAILIMIDIDRFKSINDELGHETGDRTICAFARILDETQGHSGICGRLGGEEFAVVLPGTSLQDAISFAERLRATIENHAGNDLPDDRRVTASLGVSDVAGGDISRALAQADTALYQAKKAGRNRVVAYSPHYGELASRQGGRRNSRETKKAEPLVAAAKAS